MMMIRPLFLLFFSRSSSATSLFDIYCRAYFWVWIIETQMVFSSGFRCAWLLNEMMIMIWPVNHSIELPLVVNFRHSTLMATHIVTTYRTLRRARPDRYRFVDWFFVVVVVVLFSRCSSTVLEMDPRFRCEQ